MQYRKLFHAVQPFISAIAVIATAAVLVFTIYFTELGPQWITFLTGILVAAILAEATRRSHAERVVTRRTAQLSSLKTKFERESQLRKIAEQSVAASKPRLHLIDEVLPTMVAFVNREGCCQYHNRAFLDGLRLRPEQADGRRHMRDVLGANFYRETATAARQSLDGHAAHYERTQKMPDGATYRLSVEHLPQFGLDGKVTGFFMLMNDITEPGDVRIPVQHESSVEQGMFVDSYAEQVTGQHDAGLIKMAIERGEFSLFCQQITPLSTKSKETGHYEILVRLMEEEETMIPPGMFFPLAEKYGLMTHLDRWVVQHVTEWVARQKPQEGQRKNSIFFINVSELTIADPGFPEFLQLTLQEYDVPGTALCFEVTDSALASRTADVAEFARQVRQCGCHVALSGFGRDRVLFDLIRGFQVEFLKIDGSVILEILRDPLKLAKVTAINRVAKKIGVKTIAEMVESEDTITSLREIGIDFAQGFGISRPRPLKG
jgi:PAS domain S-box-containing protein